MPGIAEEVYGRMPTAVQHVGVSAYGYMWRHQRLRGRFHAYRRLYAAHEHYSHDQWATWQTSRLREILGLAATAPAYSGTFADLGLSLLDLDRFELDDLARLPLLPKHRVRSAPQLFCPGGEPGWQARAYHTSGSTGTPITVYHSRSDLRRWYALVDARYESSVGVTYALPRATFSGRRIDTDPDSLGPYHRYNAAERQIYYSPYHLRSETVATYAEALWTHRPDWMTGYAGAIHEFARLALEQGVPCPRLRAVITSAEPVPPRLREDVFRAFGCQVNEEYGLIEGVCHVLECPAGSLHSSPDAGIVEIVDEQGRPCAPGEVGEIVSTGLVHESHLLIRYRTGDLGSWAAGACECGRATPVLEGVEGRVEDVVMAPDGRRVGRLTSVARDLPGVMAMQFVHDRPDSLIARVVYDGALPPDLRDEIARRLAERVGSSMTVDVEQVDRLERTLRGKVRGVVNRVEGLA
jgi:phenylacetate-coenzyme A ligase PaaK-like adenylate-forming protein